MFALVAAVLLALAAFGVDPDFVNLAWLGIAFLALHFAFNIPVLRRTPAA